MLPGSWDAVLRRSLLCLVTSWLDQTTPPLTTTTPGHSSPHLSWITSKNLGCKLGAQGGTIKVASMSRYCYPLFFFTSLLTSRMGRQWEWKAGREEGDGTPTIDYLYHLRSIHPVGQEEPHKGTSRQEEPRQGTSGQEEPRQGTSGQKEPHKGTSGQEEPRQGTSGQEEPHKGTFGQEEPHKGTSGQEEPCKGTSVQEAPHKGTSGQEEPRKGKSAQEEPHKGTSVLTIPPLIFLTWHKKSGVYLTLPDRDLPIWAKSSALIWRFA